jgi:hypothetical protein
VLVPAAPRRAPRLAQLSSGTRVGVVAAAVETSHTLEHSITAAALPNIARVETCAAAGPVLGRLVRRVDVIVCSTWAAGWVQDLVGATVPVIIDDRALNQRAIQMLGAIVAQHDGGPPTPHARSALAPRRPREGATPEHGGAVVRQRNDGKRRRRVRGSEGSMAEAGVATMPGERASHRPAAEACAALLMPTRSSRVLRENGDGDHATR